MKLKGGGGGVMAVVCQPYCTVELYINIHIPAYRKLIFACKKKRVAGTLLNFFLDSSLSPQCSSVLAPCNEN